MSITYEKIIKKHTQDFIFSLSNFKKTYIYDSEFECNLKIVHLNFEKLKNVKKNLNFIKNEKIFIKEKEDIIEYRLHKFKFLKHKKYGFISIETGSTELNEFLFEKRRENLLEEAKKFINYENIVCDYCGNFGYEIPKNKILDDKRILSFHDSCLKMFK